jgi:capsular polysaccharide biosynthesis protein
VFAMQEINLYRLMAFYVRNWLLIASLTLAGLLAGLAYNTFIQTPLYKSDATLLFINPSSSTSTQDTTTINNYVQLFKSRRVLEPVLNDQHIDMTYDQLVGSVDAINEKGTEVIQLSVSTKDPALSRNFLREAVVSFKQQAKNLYGKDSLSVVDNASNAQPPYNVHKVQQLVIATTAGFVLSLIVLFFIYDVKGDAIKPRVTKTIAKKKNSPAAAVKEPVSMRFKDSVASMFTRKASKPAKPAAKKPAAKKAQTPVRATPKTTKVTTTKATPVKKSAAKKPAVKKTPAKKTTTK